MLLANIPASDRHVPDFHPEWLIKWWYASPFSRFEPHLTTVVFLLILLFVVGCLVYLRRKQKQKEADWQEVHHEKQFQELKKKKTIAMQKLLDLEEGYKQAEMSEEAYKQKAADYKAYLHKINQQLKTFME